MDTYGTVRGSVLRCRGEKRKDCVFLVGVLRVWTKGSDGASFCIRLRSVNDGEEVIDCDMYYDPCRGSRFR